MSTGKVVLGILAGMAGGALLGILFAPDKGKETRRKVSKKGTDYTDSVKEKINDFLETISGKFEKVKDDVTEFAEQVQSKKAEMKNAKQQ